MGAPRPTLIWGRHIVVHETQSQAKPVSSSFPGGPCSEICPPGLGASDREDTLGKLKLIIVV